VSFLPSQRFDVSVIIPVEFHRGQAVDCTRGWAQGQNYPADRYEIILCAPNTLKPETEAEILSLLRPWDRLEKRPLNHDMPLVAEAAHLAESDLLLFTESHCIPENTALGSLLAVIAEHPEWSGFSCPTTPITHNPLSEIEAEVYATHIRRELESCGWLKVMDQCFLVRRAAYLEAGGFRAAFGHFAEWLLAAEMHRRGSVIGFHAQSVMRHHYIGDVSDLETFTLDFARGQVKYLAECGGEATSTYFPEIPELQEWRQRSRADYRWIARTKTAALPAILANYLRKRKHKKPRVPMHIVLADWLESMLKIFGTRSDQAWAAWSARRAKHRLLQALRRQNRDQAKTEFVDWFSRLVHLGRMQYFVANSSLQRSVVRNTVHPISGKLNFRVALQKNNAAEWLGFFDSEEHLEGYHFRWSKPLACVWLPLIEGHYRIAIEWGKVRPLAPYDLLRVNFDGRPVAPNSMRLGVDRLIVEVSSEARTWHRLDWIVAPFQAKDDKRLLGLPVTAIRWSSNEQSSGVGQMALLRGEVR
jgi:hypothetical protein